MLANLFLQSCRNTNTIITFGKKMSLSEDIIPKNDPLIAHTNFLTHFVVNELSLDYISTFNLNKQ